MASVDYSKVPIIEKPLYTPPLEEIVERKYFSTNFKKGGRSQLSRLYYVCNLRTSDWVNRF